MDTPYSLRRVAIGVRSDGTFQPVSSLDCSLGSSIQTYLLLSDKGRKPPVMKSLQFTFESGPNEQNYTRLVDIFVEYLRQSGIPFFTSNGIDINSNPSYRIGMLKPESLLQSKIKSLNVPTVYTIMGAMHDPHKLHDVIQMLRQRLREDIKTVADLREKTRGLPKQARRERENELLEQMVDEELSRVESHRRATLVPRNEVYITAALTHPAVKTPIHAVVRNPFDDSVVSEFESAMSGSSTDGELSPYNPEAFFIHTVRQFQPPAQQ